MARPISVAGGTAALGAAVIAIAMVLIPRWEGWRNEPYLDPASILTVCVGHVNGVEKRRYSDEECRTIFRQDLEAHAAQIAPCVPRAAPMEVQAAFLSLGFNIGPTALCGSTAARKLRAGDLTGACDAILAWNKYRDPKTKTLKVSKGLSNRRADERALCLKGVPVTRAGWTGRHMPYDGPPKVGPDGWVRV